MSCALMRQHCPQARPLGTAVLTHHRFIAMAASSVVRHHAQPATRADPPRSLGFRLTPTIAAKPSICGPVNDHGRDREWLASGWQARF
jgi:hypothetical protein